MSKLRVAIASMACMLVVTGVAYGARVSNVAATKHNLSSSSPNKVAGAVYSTTETQICVFCHTPHAATSGVTPLWNRTLSVAAYTGYTSSSLDAAATGVQTPAYTGLPGGNSKLCLSCHDGTVAIGAVNVVNSVATGIAGMTGGGPSVTTGTYTGASMPTGTNISSGTDAQKVTTGFTGVIGTNLTNDHPISMDFTTALATRDGELRAVDANQQFPAGTGATISPRKVGAVTYTPLLPLENTGTGSLGQVQCSACHDPHIQETNAATLGDQMFLRLNRFQEAAPAAAFNSTNDIICLGCHDKNGADGSWAFSSHGSATVATQTYKAATLTPRQFPANKTVWSASCVNCHNGHAPQGATHLLSEGTDGAFIGGASAVVGGVRQGGNAASENTCYQCHTLAANSIITSTAPLIDIQTEMTTGSTTKHPVTVVATAEKHDIGGNFTDTVNCTTANNKCGADGIESQVKLGRTALANRHAECTDCHNPHRIIKEESVGTAPSAGVGSVDGGVHHHELTGGGAVVHNNVASGVLRGSWGVEVTGWASTSFHSMPTGYTVKRGVGTGTVVTSAWVTREYQVCLKCHSDYAYSDNNAYGAANDSTSGRPLLGGTGLTVANPNGRSSFSAYTNQAKEFQAPSGHKGGSGTGDTPTILNSGNDGGAGMPTTTAATAYCTTAQTSRCNNNNHRSWHPVFGPTGRARFGGYLYPWSVAGAPGVQTMYCSDCHGQAATQTAGSVVPLNRSPTAAHVAGSTSWGPHGGTMTNNTQVFMLKGVWNQTTNSTTVNNLCFKCHCATNYGGTATGACTTRAGGVSGFNGSETHYSRSNHRVACQYCHVAIVHGWKNKSFLVNLEDIGPEAGSTVTTSAPTTGTYTKGPYYSGAGLRIKSFGTSGAWAQNNCAQFNNSH